MAALAHNITFAIGRLFQNMAASVVEKEDAVLLNSASDIDGVCLDLVGKGAA
jgi:hypothetical protein